jgi:hypothetical protein
MIDLVIDAAVLRGRKYRRQNKGKKCWAGEN